MAFEDLRVYQAAELLDRLAEDLVRSLPVRFADDVNHLRRAIGSLRFNIAEANGSKSPGRQHYHFEVARGSSDEARAVLRRLAQLGALDPNRIKKACTLTVTIAKMLTSLMRRLKGASNR